MTSVGRVQWRAVPTIGTSAIDLPPRLDQQAVVPSHRNLGGPLCTEDLLTAIRTAWKRRSASILAVGTAAVVALAGMGVGEATAARLPNGYKRTTGIDGQVVTPSASTSSPSRRRAARSTRSRGRRRSRGRSPRGSTAAAAATSRSATRSVARSTSAVSTSDSRAVFTCRCRRTPRPACCRSSAAASTSRSSPARSWW